MCTCVAIGAFDTALDRGREIDAIGQSVSELETAALGQQVKLAGTLDPVEEVVDHPIDSRRCVASFAQLVTISSTEDSDGDETIHRLHNVSFTWSHVAEFHFRAGERRVAVPRGRWNGLQTASLRSQRAWPSWAPASYRKNFRGSFERYEIRHSCLVAGQSFFVTGRLAKVTDAAKAVEPGAALLEVREPILWLEPSAEGRPVGVWRGDEGQRIAVLAKERRSGFIWGSVAVVGALILMGLTVFLVRLD